MSWNSVSQSDTSGAGLTRSLSPALAKIVTELELDQPFLVTMRDLERLREETGVGTSAKLLAKRLRDRGWLLPTGHSGVWEFAPGAHAGPIGRGHPFREIHAALTVAPNVDLAVCLTSALWVHGLLDKAPERPEVALRKGAELPVPLKKSSRVVRFDWRLPTTKLRSTPTHDLATILVHLAARPSDVTSWSAVLDVLPELVERAGMDPLHEELADRPHAVKTRLAYLLHGIEPKLARQLASRDHGKVWFGPRGKLKRHNQTFNVADTILPISPSLLKPANEMSR